MPELTGRRCSAHYTDPPSGRTWRCTLPVIHDGKHKMSTVGLCAAPGCWLLGGQGGGKCQRHRTEDRAPGLAPGINTCGHPGCDLPTHAQDLCTKHYQRAKSAERCDVIEKHDHHSPCPPDWVPHIEAFSANRRLADQSSHTIELRTAHLRRLAREVGKPPFDLTSTDLEEWLGGHRWSNETVRSVRASIIVFYTWAVASGRIEKSPAADLPQPKPGRRNPKPVSEADFATALMTAPPRFRLALKLAGQLGMRRAEVAATHIDHLIKTDDGYLLRVLGKGRKERLIPIGDTFADELTAHVRTYGQDGYAFPPEAGSAAPHISPHWMGTMISRLLPDGYTMHKLRHRALTQAYRNSKDILLTAALAGHASVATTQAYYVAPDYSQLRTIVDGLAS